MRNQTLSVAALGAILLGGCATHDQGPTISHVILIALEDKSQAEELLGECNRLLAPIPSVRAFAAGPPIDTGRDTVLADYDVGIVIGFDSAEGYREYVEHPSHVELVDTWGPRFTSIRVFDIHDDGQDEQ